MDTQQLPIEARPRRTATVVTTLVILLALLVAVSSGVGPALGVLGLALGGLGVVAVVRGHVPSARIASRRMGVAVGAAGLLAITAGGALSATPVTTASSDAAAPLVTAAPSTVLEVPLVPPTTTPTTSSAPALPPAPEMNVTCPAGGGDASPVFEQRIAATAPYQVVIDYGDGDVYTDDDQHLAAVFSHSYAAAGTFAVHAVLTDAAGQTASSGCSYTWARSVPIVGSPSGRSSSSSKSSTGAGSSRTSSDGAPSDGSSGGLTSDDSSSDGSSSSYNGGDTYTNSAGSEVHVPVEAPSAPDGASAECNDGTYSFSKHRSGTCSGHRGVAQWVNKPAA